jgi:uncharacterized SAM-binding protein YcdF (DUF218 family)
MKIKRILKSKIGKIGIVLLFAVVIWVCVLQWRMASVQDNPSAHGDVGIVLGASLWGNIPSPSLQERLERAVALYKARSIPYIIVSGGYDHKDSALSEAEGMRNYLITQGIPENVIILENQATSTYENLLFSQVLMKQRGWQSAVIITHRYHMLRALEMADFLNYTHPEASPVDSEVLYMPWHKARETISYVKWYLEMLLITAGAR